MEDAAFPSRLLAKLDQVSSDEERLVSAIDAWCSEVLSSHTSTVRPNSIPPGLRDTLDDLVGAYKARDRIERVVGASDLVVVRVADELLKSFTVDEGPDWVDAHGHLGEAGDGWWWSRLPSAGWVRDELDRADLA